MLIIGIINAVLLVAILVVQGFHLKALISVLHVDLSEVQVADQSGRPELPDDEMTDLLGSEELHLRNEEHDRKIKAIIDEIESKEKVGTVYNVPHVDITLREGEEYAE